MFWSTLGLNPMELHWKDRGAVTAGPGQVHCYLLKQSGCQLHHWGTRRTTLGTCYADEEMNLWEDKQDLIEIIFLGLCTTLKQHSKPCSVSCFVLSHISAWTQVVCPLCLG